MNAVSNVTFVCNIMACQDCLMLVANGELPDERPELEDDIDALWGVSRSRFFCVGDSDQDDEFSWRACECCGSELGGSRHQLAVMQHHV